VAKRWIRDCSDPKEGLLSNRISQRLIEFLVFYGPEDEDAGSLVEMVPVVQWDNFRICRLWFDEPDASAQVRAFGCAVDQNDTNLLLIL
jgi:hypothetical protein